MKKLLILASVIFTVLFYSCDKEKADVKKEMPTKISYPATYYDRANLLFDTSFILKSLSENYTNYAIAAYIPKGQKVRITIKNNEKGKLMEQAALAIVENEGWRCERYYFDSLVIFAEGQDKIAYIPFGMAQPECELFSIYENDSLVRTKVICNK